tara:strand:- start:89 stop:292 length:204 start_codon:yes stop_codon:yes gene_type:complete
LKTPINIKEKERKQNQILTHFFAFIEALIQKLKYKNSETLFRLKIAVTKAAPDQKTVLILKLKHLTI